MAAENPPILRPVPRRPFDINLTSASPTDSSPSSPSNEPTRPYNLDSKSNGFGNNEAEPLSSFSRTHSILNLTSSTLLGIYSNTGYNNEREEPSTPWGTEAETPARASIDGYTRPMVSPELMPTQTRSRSFQHIAPSSPSNTIFSIILRSSILFCIGLGYGLVVTHLHNDQKVAPFHVEGIIKPSYDWRYLVFWGVAGVGMGSLLPWVDMLWEGEIDNQESFATKRKRRASIVTDEDEEAVPSSASGLAADWNPLVRSIGAFVGIAFAIRRLSWASTLQVSLTLALVNPVLWYLIDRSKTGFMLSSAVGLMGTGVLLSLNPEMMPSPLAAHPSLSSNSSSQGISPGDEILGGLVWIASVLFCSCVCFGNVGRRLALKKGRPRSTSTLGRRESFR